MTAIEVLRVLDEVVNFDELVYSVRDSEGKGWDGPQVKKCCDAVSQARELIQADTKGKL